MDEAQREKRMREIDEEETQAKREAVLARFRPYRSVVEFLADKWAPLIAAIIERESGFRPLSVRYEPGFYRRYIAHDAIWKRRMEARGWNPVRVSSSFGLMQIMFPTAWTEGFRREPEELLVPEVNLVYGTKRFFHLLERYENPVDAVAAYNAGTPRRREGVYVNQPYVDFVMEVAAMIGGKTEWMRFWKR